ncbi:MAG: heavy-metal-associated domain-containing protein [Chromatiales bacterium]|nr:heavy-metal-associated domain-containing protein [Chromatiales bacterium]
MTQETFTVQNVKCGGCASTIESGVSEMAAVNSVTVEVESGTVTIESDGIERATLSSKLAELGYPEA